VTAWAFAAAGLGASLGVSAAVVFGVMTFVAALPGTAVLLLAWLRRTRSLPRIARPPAGALGIFARRDEASDA
jgi:hypothetical protein